MSKFQVGQVLWYAPYDRRNRPSVIVVSSVGRKWVKFNRDSRRFDASTMEVDGGQYSSPGKIWMSREDYEADSRIQGEWGYLGRDVYFGKPAPGLTLDDIAQARKLLRLDQ